MSREKSKHGRVQHGWARVAWVDQKRGTGIGPSKRVDRRKRKGDISRSGDNRDQYRAIGRRVVGGWGGVDQSSADWSGPGRENRAWAKTGAVGARERGENHYLSGS